MKTTWIHKVCVLLLACALSVPLSVPALAEEEAILIASAEDLVSLAQSCALDAWSEGKTVRLTGDISLASVDFSPIPTFSGIFDGDGHTVSGLELSARLSPAGLFSVVREGAEIRNLTVSGRVAPSGDGGMVGGIAGENNGTITNCGFSGNVAGQDSVGGIAGKNGLTGRITSCTVSGGVNGKSMTGGIAGENRGSITDCQNNAYVNVSNLDPSLNLSELELNAQLLTLRTMEAANIATDTGGITGFSDGMILQCVNTGMVGYRHVGYNVGGITGRSSGFISGCVNRGPVFGRKDVGGIAGQAEPYIVLDLSEDTIQTMEDQLHRLEDLMNQAASDMDGISSSFSSAFTGINDSLDAASERLDILSDRLGGYGGDIVSEINRGSDVLDETVSQLSAIANSAAGLSERVGQGLDTLERAVRELADTDGYLEDVSAQLRDAGDRLSVANRLLGDGMRELQEGMALLSDALSDQNTEKMQQALGLIGEGAVDFSNALASLDYALGELREASSLREVKDILESILHILRNELHPAFQTINGAIPDLVGNINMDLSAMQPGLDAVQDALGTLASSSDALGKALAGLDDALAAAEPVTEQAKTALESIGDGLDILEGVFTDGETVFDGVRDLADYLDGVEPLTFARPDEELSEASDGVFDALEQLGVSLDQLNSAASSSTGTATHTIRSMNNQFSALMDTVFDAIRLLENAGEESPVSDTSEADVDAVTNGKIYQCTNHADINGDLCAGGVTGSMGVEYELDPEDDILNTGAPAYRRAYELKVILQSCVNRGNVTGRRDYTGGLCGRMHMGLVTGGENYAAVTSEGGDYTGGIAGFAAGAVRDCWAKCTLSGTDYVGGIVGAAAIPGDTDSGEVSGCHAFVKIADGQQYIGAVSGTEQGVFQNNYFTSDILAGLGCVSMTGKAEPLAYEALLETEGLPAAFRRLTLRFIVNGMVLKSVDFQYGDSFDDSVFPDLPEKKGEYAVWDRSELLELRFDTDVTAQYTPCRTNLFSEELREDGRPVLFVEGQFSGNAGLTLTPSEAEIPLGDTPFTRRSVVEQLQARLPEDGADVHTLRYLSPSGSVKNLEIYLLRDGNWKQVETEAVGTYLTFTAEGTEPVMAAVTQISLWWLWLTGAIILTAAAVGIWQILRHLKARTARKGKKAAKETSLQEAAVKTATETSPQEMAAKTTTETLRKETVAEKTKVTAFKPRKRRRWLWGVLAAVLAVTIGGAVLLTASDVLDGAAAARLLYRCARDTSIPLDLMVQAHVDGQDYSAGSELRRIEWEGRAVTCARQWGTAVYYCGGKVYLENGCAYNLGDEPSAVQSTGQSASYATLLDTVRLLYKNEAISVYKNEGEKIYSLTVQDSSVEDLVRIIFPEIAEWASLQTLNMDLVARSGAMTQLRFAAEGVLSNGQSASLSATLTAGEKEEPPDIPKAVQEAILNGAAETIDLLPLLRAWDWLNLRDPLPVQVSLSAACGPLALHDQLELFRTWEEGKPLYCIQKAGRTLYFTADGQLYDEEGAVFGAEDEDITAPARLPELAYRLCLSGIPAHTVKNGMDVYTLNVPPEELTAAAQAIAPAAAALNVGYSSGRLEIAVSEGEIQRITLSCSGELQLQLVPAPASVSCELLFAPAELDIPESVRNALHRRS